jgi:hypothetical protein
MTHATQTLIRPTPRKRTMSSTENLAVVERLRKDLDTEPGIDWRTDWEKIGTGRIQAIVDEMFPGPQKCGVGRAYRIRDLLPVVPEDLPEPSASQPEPEKAPTAQLPEAEPTVPIQLSAPEVALPAPDESKVVFRNPEPNLPEPTSGRLRRVAAGTGVLAVAVVAAMISYTHQKQLASTHGQTGILADVWPLGVDGLILGCGIMVATDRLRGYQPRPWALAGFWLGVVVSIICNALAGDAGWLARAISAFPAVALLIAIEALTTGPTRRRRVVSPTTVTHP